MKGILIGLRRSLLKLRGNTEGVGAVEFALIAPVLIVLYMGSLEISIALSVDKKIARASSTVADLITQNEQVNKVTLASMINVAQSVLMPFGSTAMKLKVTGITIDSSGVARTAWSWQEDGTRPYPVNSAQKVPADLLINDTFLVRTELEYKHKMLLFLPGLSDVDVRTLNMNKTYYLRQRLGDSVTCTDC